MAVGSAVMAPTERSTALAIGYGLSQTVAAILLTYRVHRITGSMGPRTVLRVLGEALSAGAVSVVVMLWIVSLFGTRRRQAAEAMLLAGVAGVAVFAGVMALLRWREFAGRRVEQLP
jgi:hypothetical protein